MSCTSGRETHNWDLWVPTSEQERENSPWWFKRECQTLGCACVEYAQRVEAVGATKLVEAWHNRKGERVEGTFKLDKP